MTSLGNPGAFDNLGNLIDALAAAPGERPFITSWIDEDERETVTFGEFRGRAQQHATLLRNRGVIAGDRVVIIMPQGIPAMTMFAGAMMIGAVPAFLAYPNFKVEAEKYRSGLAGVTANLRAKIVVIDDKFPGDMLAHVTLGEDAALLRASNGADTDLSAGSEKLPDLKAERDALAFIQHSAGTTGLQKGVALTHGAVLKQIEHLAAALKINGNSDRIYSWLPLYHDMGLIACFMLPLVCHVPVVMQSPLDWVMHPESMLQIFTEYKCTLAWMPNFAFQFIPRRAPRARWEQYDLSSARALINCSEPVRASSMDEFQNAFSSIGLRDGVLQSSYAMAENVFAVTQSGQSPAPTRIWADGRKFRSAQVIEPVAEGTAGAVRFTSSGRLLAGNKVRIVSASGEVLPHGCVGEILIQSDSLFAGYYNRPDLTAEALIDGWYHGGDLGFYLQSDDELYVVGRKKDLLIIGGENIYAQDIEEAVSGHPSIHDGRVVAIGVYNPELGTEEIAVVAEVQHEELLASATDIEQELRNRVVAEIGVSVRTIFLKRPHWIVKSTAGKAARSATCEKLLREHPELDVES